MCETFLHPRPDFSTFLRSDVNGPPRTNATLRHCNAPMSSTKLGNLYKGRFIKVESLEEFEDTCEATLDKESPIFHPIFTPLIDTISGTISSAIELNYTGKYRSVTSGGYAKFYDDCNINKPPHRTTPSKNSNQRFSRPQTAPARIDPPSISSSASHHLDSQISARLKSADVLTEELIERCKVANYDNYNADIAIQVEDSGLPNYRIIAGELVPRMTVTLPPSKPERDALELKTRYTSVSHKTMEEIPWTMKSAPAVLKPTRESRPDMVRQQLARYEERAHAWQCLGPSFDRASPRRHFFSAKPIAFISESRQTKYTPGYTGEVPIVSGELGVPDRPVVMKTEIKRDLPPPTGVSRKANISGYTGYVRPESIHPAHHLAPSSIQLTTHRKFPPVGNSQGPVYPRINPISNLVTLTHPYNPYNKMNPSIKQRA